MDHVIVQAPLQSGEKADLGGKGQGGRACESCLCEQHRIDWRLEAGSKSDGEGDCGERRAKGVQAE